MALLQAPQSTQFATVSTGNYPSTILAVKPLDYTKTPDPFGNVGHWSLEFRWELDDMVGDDEKPVQLPHTIKFQVGDHPAKKGARIGHMPWLTEYTRALGMPDILPGQTVDTDVFLGKRAMLAILLDKDADGKEKSKINGIAALGQANGTARRAKPAPKPAIEPLEDDDVPF